MDNIKNTGEICEVGGLYECVSHRTIRRRFKSGDKFPECITSSGSSHFTTWSLVPEKTEDDE